MRWSRRRPIPQASFHPTSSYSPIMAASLYLAIGAALLLAQRVRRVRKERFARRDALLAKYAHLADDPSKMTYHEAEDISKLSGFYVSWGLLRGYGLRV